MKKIFIAAIAACALLAVSCSSNVDKLIDMGAQIILCDPHRAVVIGHDRRFTLKPRSMSSPDIRAGMALLIAAMSADGVSRIDNIEQIDRGYQNLEERLNQIGAKITRS